MQNIENSPIDESELWAPSGRAISQLKKDAKQRAKADSSLSFSQALDEVSRDHGAVNYADALAKAKAFYQHRSKFRGPLWCVKCERIATTIDLFDLARCRFHADLDLSEDSIPEFRGAVPDGCECFEKSCVSPPTRIYGGACFCDEHYADAVSGNRYRRNVFALWGQS